MTMNGGVAVQVLSHDSVSDPPFHSGFEAASSGVRVIVLARKTSAQDRLLPETQVDSTNELTLLGYFGVLHGGGKFEQVLVGDDRLFIRTEGEERDYRGDSASKGVLGVSDRFPGLGVDQRNLLQTLPPGRGRDDPAGPLLRSGRTRST